MSSRGNLFLLPFALCLVVGSASAQLLRPPGDVPGAQGVIPAQTQDAAGLMLRIDRLEGQVRQQTGQIEELQFQNKRLEDQLRKFQQDVEFRFQDNSARSAPTRPSAPAPAPAPGKRSELNENGYPVIGRNDDDLTPETPPPPRVATSRRQARGADAFDPDSDPAAPGAPLPLGQTPSPSAPPRVINPRVAAAPALPAGGNDDPDLGADLPSGPLDLTHGMRGSDQTPAGAPRSSNVAMATPRPPASDAALPAPGEAEPGAPATPRQEFDAAVALLRANRFDAAEAAFHDFIDKHPRDRLVAEATFNLGETYYRRSRSREAAEQYLKVSTDYKKSPRAPEALLKLGQSLQKLGYHEQACAAYGEISRDYPAASPAVKASADRETKRGQC